MASAPQSQGLVVAAGCQKRRRRVKRDRVNRAAVPLQSRHTSRRRVVAGQQPQSHGLVVAAGCQKRRRRVRGLFCSQRKGVAITVKNKKKTGNA